MGSVMNGVLETTNCQSLRYKHFLVIPLTIA